MKIQICWTPKPGSSGFAFLCVLCVCVGSACFSIYPACRQKGPENNRCSMARGECARERMSEWLTSRGSE